MYHSDYSLTVGFECPILHINNCLAANLDTPMSPDFTFFMLFHHFKFFSWWLTSNNKRVWELFLSLPLWVVESSFFDCCKLHCRAQKEVLNFELFIWVSNTANIAQVAKILHHVSENIHFLFLSTCLFCCLKLKDRVLEQLIF